MNELRRLIEVGFPPEQAREILRLIQAVSGNESDQTVLDDHEAHITALEQASSA